MNIIIFEDEKYKLLYPFTINHATFEMKVGVFSNLARIIKIVEDYHNDEINIFLQVRDEIKSLVQERFPDMKVNPDYTPQGFYINGRTIASKVFFEEFVNSKKSYSIDGNLIAYYNDTRRNLDDSIIDKILKVTKEYKYNYITFLWDVFSIIGEIIQIDFSYFLINNEFISHPSLIRINEDRIHIGKRTIIKGGVVLDASKGPIIIDCDVIINSGSVIEGPVYIGNNSEISPLSLIRSNTSIGQFCKIGGEVTCTIFHDFSNKVHHGFIGHSFIGEWVNIGAGTNNSNLKNNYGEVKILFDEEIINTRLQFMGVLIGDYSRIAIGTNLNTGTYMPLGVNLFNYKINNKKIISFSWGVDKKVNFEKFMITINKMKERRNQNVSSIEYDFLKLLYASLNIN